VNAIPPTITLSAPFAASQVGYKDMLAWEQAVRAGNPAGRADAMVTLISPAGTAIATYHLTNGFPVKVDVAAGDPQSASFTVELTGDELALVNATS
jgi:hypothetical protein